MQLGMDMQRAEAQAGAALREIMDGDGYFDCAKYRCRMPVMTCLARQRENHVSRDSERGTCSKFPGCDECNQGDDIQIAHAKSGASAKSQPSPGKATDNIVPAQAGIQKRKEVDGMATETSRGDVPYRNQIIIGHCRNCDRDGVKVLICMKMCYQCITYATGMKGEERIRRLAEAAELYRSLKPDERLPHGARWKNRGKSAAGGATRPGSLPEVPPSVETKPRKKARKGSTERGIRQPELREVEAIAKTVDIRPLIDIVLQFPTDRDLALRKTICVQAETARRTPDQHILWLLEEFLAREATP